MAQGLPGIDKPPSTVYFVGDTPESDIRGTNEFNEISDMDWFSILVKTGVYEDGNTPSVDPRKICNNIYDAVKFAVEREHEKLQNGTTAPSDARSSGLKN